MTGVVTHLDARTGQGTVVLTRGVVRNGAQRFFPFAAADVTGGRPQVGARVAVSICWPSTGQPFAVDVRILGAPAESRPERS
jgi:hypothetical protein